MRTGDLEKWLADEKAKFNADPQNEKYLGKWEDQEIYVPVFEWNKPDDRYARDGAFDYKGLGRDVMIYWEPTGLGIVIDHNEKRENKNA